VAESASPAVDDRFDRLRRIAWWDQDRIRAARVLVIGAGALGNEILKNLALMGVGNVFVADLDSIERSNLSRSVLFRERDNGRPKAQVAAEAIRDIYPDMVVHWFHGDVVYDLGLGVFRWADVVLAGLDNREARLWINRYCYKTGRPMVDGATEVLQGVVRVFVPPDGSCYECSMSKTDWDVIGERRGCGGMRPEGLPAMQIPTTSVTASVIAAIQCQEAVKLLHGLETLAGRGMVFNGIANDCYTFRINFSDTCNSHETLDRVVTLRRSARDTTIAELLDMVRAELGPGAVLEFNQELLIALRCPRCEIEEAVMRPLGSVSERAAMCPGCGVERSAIKASSIEGGEPFLTRSFAAIGVPLFDIVTGRKGLARVGFEFSADGPDALGLLWRSSAHPEGGLS
jgi:adenylyltransferase/sulfurtransferase